MKKIPVATLVVLIMVMINSSGYSQDTTTAVPSDPAGQSLVKKEKINSKWEYSVNFTGKKVSGYTEYHIKFIEVYEYHSVLAFPTDGYIGGVNISCEKKIAKGKGHTYGFDFSIESFFIQPKEAMVDSDWVTLPGNDDPGVRWVNGATKSDAELKSFGLNCRAKYNFYLNQSAECVFGIGYRYQRYNYDITGLSGWYEDYYYHYIVNPEYFAGINGIDYKVTYHLPYLGLDLVLKNKEGISLTIGSNIYYAMANDLDDHLLRFKTAESHCKGSGYTFSGATKINLITLKNGRAISLGGSYNITRIKATGTQVQNFYADDPGTTEVETGLTFDGIDNTIALKQNTITAQLEYQF